VVAGAPRDSTIAPPWNCSQAPEAWIAFTAFHSTGTGAQASAALSSSSILVDKLPKERRLAQDRPVHGHVHACRPLLLVLAWIVGLVTPLFTVLNPGNLRPSDYNHRVGCSYCGRVRARFIDYIRGG
jgi:hypothetical protein